MWSLMIVDEARRRQLEGESYATRNTVEQMHSQEYEPSLITKHTASPQLTVLLSSS
jgi:hypothetical protein